MEKTMDKRTLYIISIVALALSLLAFGCYIYLSMKQDKNVNLPGKPESGIHIMAAGNLD